VGGEKKRILVIDDEQQCLEFAVDVLAGEGFDVITAMDGEEGLKRARSESPDLIILDVFMPEQDGWDTCDKLRDAAETRQVPIVYLTCVESPKTLYTEHGAYETDWDEYLTKPVTGKQLLGVVRRLLEKAAAPR
jgi:two-component system alkaline phosphatase synthesis response regulator PhoP